MNNIKCYIELFLTINDFKKYLLKFNLNIKIKEDKLKGINN